MGNTLFRLSDIGEGIAEVEIIAWHIKAGDQVTEDQHLLDVMTDKANVEITSPFSGRIAARHGNVGEKAKVGSVLLEFEQSITADDSPADRAAHVAEKTVSRAAQEKSEQRDATHALASPVTRKRAKELGIHLETLIGTGPEGRITEHDLDRMITSQSHLPPQAQTGLEDGVKSIPIIGLRRKIAERMQQYSQIPHFTYVEEFDCTELEKLRYRLNENRAAHQTKLTLLPLFMRALANILPQFPNFNSHYDEKSGVLKLFAGIHIGIATRTAAGLLVPVIRHVERLDLWGCARALNDVTTAARNGTAKRLDLSGSTITLTSLGPLGGIAATPIINAPEVAIIGPNKLMQRPIFVDGTLRAATLMNVSSSFDHRIIDGYDAASFIQELKSLIESPIPLSIP